MDCLFIHQEQLPSLIWFGNYWTQFSMGNDQYPKTLTAATDILSNHKLDDRGDSKKKKSQEQSRPQPNPDDNPRTGTETSFAQSNQDPMICYCCGKEGHVSSTCPKAATLPPNKWYMRRAVQHLHSAEQVSASQSGQSDPTPSTQSSEPTPQPDSNSNNNNNDRPLWFGCQLVDRSGLNHNQNKDSDCTDSDIIQDLINILCIDSGSSCHTLANEKFADAFWDVITGLFMSTNVGSKRINQKASIPGLGEAWFDETGLTNCLSLFEMAKRYHITFDNHKENAFLVHIRPGVVIKFVPMNGIYGFRPPQNFLDAVAETKRQMQSQQPIAETKEQSLQPLSVKPAVSNLVSTVNEN